MYFTQKRRDQCNSTSPSSPTHHSMASQGELSLQTLLTTLTVTLQPQTYTFLTLPSGTSPFSNTIPTTSPNASGIQMLFHEPTENQWTLILDSTSETLSAYRALGAESSPTQWRMLTLDLQSSLDAVGFMAVVSKALTNAGVSANVVAAYLHDHIFVQADRAETARLAIEKVAEDARAKTETVLQGSAHQG